MRKIWEAKISRKDWKMKPTHRLCELHFRQEDIITGFEHPLLGPSRQKKLLKPDAIPVLFSHKSMPPPKRKPPTHRKPSSPAKKQKIIELLPEETPNQTAHSIAHQSEETECLPAETHQGHDDITDAHEAGQEVSRDFGSLRKLFEQPDVIPLPADWMVRRKYNLTYFHVNDEIVIDKYITLEEDNDLATVFINTKDAPSLSCKINDCEQMQRHIERVNAIKLCPGTGIGKERSKACLMYIDESTTPSPSEPKTRCNSCSIYRKAGIRREQRRRSSELKRHLKSKSVNRILTTTKKKVRFI